MDMFGALRFCFALKRTNGGVLLLMKRNNIPETIDSALERIQELNTPTHIRVWINKKHPQVMDRDYSGTAFKHRDKK